MNYLFLGDCLNVLRDNVMDESVDLIYIDPPFNSKRDYSMFFDDKEIHTQRVAFEDTWTLKNISDSIAELHTLETDDLYKLLETYREVAPHAYPYLVMMGLRIVELRRVLRKTGSFYLHCDPTMSHYLKTVCDVVFGVTRFFGENIWQKIRTTNNDNRKEARAQAFGGKRGGHQCGGWISTRCPAKYDHRRSGRRTARQGNDIRDLRNV